MENNEIIELISKVDEFIEISELFDNDRDIDVTLSKIVRLIANPDLEPKSAQYAIVHLQALATKFAIQASYFKNMSKPSPGTDEYKRKNMLFSIVQALENLVQALKYLIK